MTKVLHYEEILAFAEGEIVQYKEPNSSYWVTIDHCIRVGVFDDPTVELRLKSKTIRVNGSELAAPVRKALNYGDNYFIPVFHSDTETTRLMIWTNSTFDRHCLAQGLIYLKEEDALALQEAMLSPLKLGT